MGAMQPDIFKTTDDDKLGSIPVAASDRGDLLRQLTDYPYCAVMTGAGDEDSAAVAELMVDLGADPETLTTSRIEYNPEKLAQAQVATSQSRSADAMTPHTDSSFRAEPHELLAFHFLSTSDEGGLSLVQPVDDLVAGLSAEEAALLRQRPLPHGEQLGPALVGEGPSPSIRFNANQIEKTAEGRPDAEDLTTVCDMVARASAAAPMLAHQAAPGDVVLINNRKALHARTAFPADSGRLMIRLRARCAPLGVAGGA